MNRAACDVAPLALLHVCFYVCMMCCVLCCGEVVASAIVWNKGPVMTIPYVWIHDQELVAPF